MGWLERLLTSRGHGVHSPFAFRFITDVIGERYSYYAYDEIDATTRGRDNRLARLLYRVGVFFHRQPIEIIGPLSDGCRHALELAGNKLTSAAAHTPVAIVTDMSRWNSLRQSMTGGMTFTDGRIGIAVRNHALPLSHFKLRF